MESILSLLGVLLVSGVVIAQEPPSPDKVYIIQSRDGGTLAPSGSGTICKQLSNLTSTQGLKPPYADQYKWKVSAQSVEGIRLYNLRREEGYIINELAFDDYPPYCYVVYRELMLIPRFSALVFAIHSVRTGQCLTSFGSEVTWAVCAEAGQGFDFVETE